MIRYFTRTNDIEKEENTLFGTLDHWVEVKASTLMWNRVIWATIGAVSTYTFLVLVKFLAH